MFFSDGPVNNYAGAARCDTEAYAAWCRGLLARGVYPPPSQFEAWFPSLAHSEADVRRTVDAAAEAFAEARGAMRTARDGAHALRDALRGEGGTVAACLADPLADRPADSAALDRPGPAQVAATGPRTRGRASEYEVLLEMILEGYRLHYDEPLVVRPDDADLALLLGDQLYALGLARLAELGDLEAVAELADVISLAAQAHSAADPELARGGLGGRRGVGRVGSQRGSSGPSRARGPRSGRERRPRAPPRRPEAPGL